MMTELPVEAEYFVHLMRRLKKACCLQVLTYALIAVEQVQRHCIDHPCGGGIVSSAFVPHEGMGGVEFVPGEVCSSVGQRLVNRCPAFAGNVWVLPAKHHQEFALDLRDSIERVVV